MNFQTRDRRCRTITAVPEPTDYELFIANFLQTTSAAQVLVLLHSLKKRRVINFFKKHISLSVFQTYTKAQMSYILQKQLFRTAFSTADQGDTLVLTIGNTTYRKYAKNGGSRLILGFVENAVIDSTMSVTNPNVSDSYVPPTNGYAKYANLDFTNPVSMSFDFDLRYLRSGVVACVYLVPMKRHIDPSQISSYYYYKNMNDSRDASYAQPYVDNTLLAGNNSNTSDNQAKMLNYADECGMGYNDAQSVGMGGSIEIDCIEATPCGLSVTLHGKSGSGYDTGGVWCNVHNNMSTTGASLSKKINGTQQTISGVDLSTYGPSSNYFINSLLPFHVDVATTFSASETLILTVTISQILSGQLHELVFEVVSGGFTVVEGLQHMNVIVSLWMSPVYDDFQYDANTSWWLDGYKIGSSNSSTSVRGPCSTQNYGTIPTTSYDTTTQTVSGANLLPDIYKYYNDYAIPVVQAEYDDDEAVSAHNPSIFILQNMNISKGIVNLDSTKKSLPVYIQDFMYRGQGGPWGAASNFTGRYDSAYGVAYAQNTDPINIDGFIPEVSSTVTPSTNSAYWIYQTPSVDTLDTDYSFGGKLNMKNMSKKEIIASNFMGNCNVSNFSEQHKVGSFFFDAPSVILNGIYF